MIASATLQDLLDFHDTYYLTTNEVNYVKDKGGERLENLVVGFFE